MMFFILLLHSVNVAICGTRTPRAFDYECGSHGRFEYCIEGLPGCVVGCHCYPGYYFDTESKICEHNTKLTQDFRRMLPPVSYNLPLHGGINIDNQQQQSPSQLQSPPFPNVADKQDDDLSDWLYNQFFKTVESQVINKTDGDKLMLKTRRSGSPLVPITRRRSSKKKRKKTKKRQRKNDDDDDEDDEIDSDSDSDSSSSSSSSDSDDSGSLGSWERYEFDKPKPDKDGKPEDGDGGAHRQIVVYSKKPKPPLPSFIFLPNMNSPFYPPIGLSAPAMPAMPMYPMVPVPPMVPDIDCTDQTGATTAEPTTGGSTTAPTTKPAPTNHPSPTTDPSPTTNPSPTTEPTTVPGRRKVLRNNGKFFDLPNRKRPHLNSVHRPNLLQNDYFMNDDYQELQYPDRTYIPKSHLQNFDRNLGIEEGKANFKYLSQLIHRDSQKSTTQLPGITYSIRRQSNNAKTLIPYDIKKRIQVKPDPLNDTRRFDTRINGQDDSYYSTLGRQIAKLIRGIESIDEAGLKNEPAVDINPAQAIPTQNTISARSYWERFIRSPLNMILMNMTQNYNPIPSNEELFDLENKVQEVTTAPGLSLLELENIINKMRTLHRVHTPKIEKYKNKASNSSLNISLLPGLNQRNIIKDMLTSVRNEINETQLDKPSDDRHMISQQLQSNKRPAELQEPPNKVKDYIAHSVISKNLVPNEIPNNRMVITPIGRTHPIDITRWTRRKLSDFISHTPSKMFNVKSIKYIDDSDQIHQTSFKNNNYRPLLFEAGGTDFVNSKKYFVDNNANGNYYFEN